MKSFFRLFIALFLGLFFIISAYAFVNISTLNAYYDFENASAICQDKSALGNDCVNSGTTNVSSDFLPNGGTSARNFDGSNDFLTISTGIDFANGFTMGWWQKADTTSGVRALWRLASGDNFQTFYNEPVFGTGLCAAIFSGGWTAVCDASPTTTNTHYIFTFDATNMELFRNGSSIANQTSTIGGSEFGDAKFSDGSSDYDGIMDEFTLFNKSLNQTEALDLFLNGVVFVVPVTISFENVSANGETLSNNTFFNTTDLDFLIELNSSNNNTLINLSYSLDGAGFVSFSTNSINGTLNLTLNESLHTIQFFAENNETNETSEIFNFTVDVTAPELNISLPTEVFSYLLNLSQNISVSDFSTCTVRIFDINSTGGKTFVENNTCSNQSYVFPTNGNKSLDIFAIDLAGNLNASINNTILVNPLQNFSFVDITNTTIENFSFNNINFTTIAFFPIFDLVTESDLPTNITLTFEKLGFVTTNITFSLNSTSELDITTQVNTSTLLVDIFDRGSRNLLTGLTTLTLIGPAGFNTTTTTGQVNISNMSLVPGDYQLLAEHSGFSTESIFFSFSGQENIPLKLYLLNLSESDAGTITIIVKDQLSQFVEGAIVKVLEWIPGDSAFSSVAEGTTNVEGEVLFNIQLETRVYKFQATKSSITTVTGQEIIQVNGDTRTIILVDIGLETDPALEGFSFISNETLLNNFTTVSFFFNDADNLVSQGCLTTYRVSGLTRTQLNQSCVSSSSSEIFISTPINETFNVEVVASVSIGSIDYPLKTFSYESTEALSSALSAIGLDVIIPMTILLLGLGLGLVTGFIELGVIGTFIGIWVSVLIVPSVISTSLAVFVSGIGIIMLWGGFRKK